MKRPVVILLVCLLAGLGAFLLLTRQTDPSRIAPASWRGAELAARFDGQRAHAHTAAVLAFGPRPPASQGLARTLDYLEAQLATVDWSCRRQTFRATTPEGPLTFTNLIARYDPFGDDAESRPWLLGGHIDSKKLPGNFVGANDGGSSTGILLELARVLATEPEAAAVVEIVFFDGEEALGPDIIPRSGYYPDLLGRPVYRQVDGLYGSKHYAQTLSRRRDRPGAAVILDIVGDPDHALLVSETRPPFLDAIQRIASRYALDPPLRVSTTTIVDDHIPLQQQGIPCLHLIGDFAAMDYWHTPADTLDRVRPGMLEKVGRMTLEFLAEASALPRP